MVECAYHAATVWLPLTLLLPYWMLLAVGLVHPARPTGRGPLQLLLLGLVLPSLAAVGATIMHKRTGMFLLPAAAAWVALGCEVLAHRLAGRLDRSRLLVAATVLALLAADLGRSVYRLRRSPNTHDPASYVAATILRDGNAEAGPVWAFGSEPEVYAFWSRPIYYPFRDREAD